MTGAELITRVRTLLRDEQSATKKGEFWSQDEILLALNAAQDILLNFCLTNKYTDVLRVLLSVQGNLVSGTLSGFCHLISGMTGDTPSELRIARVYQGGEGFAYQRVIHDAIIYIGDQVTFLKGDNTNSVRLTNGKIWFYSYPTPIILGVFNDEFRPEIYHNVIARHASVLLAMKETQTQRDFKNAGRSVRELVSYIPDMARYILDYDMVVEPPQPVQQPIQTQSNVQ